MSKLQNKGSESKENTQGVRLKMQKKELEKLFELCILKFKIIISVINILLIKLKNL